jgi:hypothetical protein
MGLRPVERRPRYLELLDERLERGIRGRSAAGAGTTAVVLCERPTALFPQVQCAGFGFVTHV